MLKARVAVFVSGGGTNLQALLDADMPHADIVLVLSNREDAYALQRARAAGVDAFALPRGAPPSSGKRFPCSRATASTRWCWRDFCPS